MDAADAIKGRTIYTTFVADTVSRGGVPAHYIMEAVIVAVEEGYSGKDAIVRHTYGGLGTVNLRSVFKDKAEACSAVARELRKFAAKTLDAANEVEHQGEAESANPVTSEDEK
jgi:hypothetical protein